MKKIIIPVVLIITSGLLIGMVLSGNKKKNEQKIEIVNQGSSAAPVKVTTVARQNINLNFSANGNFVPNQDLKLLSDISGRVLSIRVQEGDRVQKGQVLATLDEKYLSLDLETAGDTYNKLKTDKERYESSFKTGGVTQAQLDDIDLQLRNAAIRLEQARRKIGDAHIKAPISGIINKKHIEVGSYLSAGNALFDIVDVSNLKLNVAANEKQMVQLKKGDKVAIQVPAFPDQTFSGAVSFIAPKADASLNFPVEIKVDNDGAQLIKAGMFATAVFQYGNEATAIIVPRSAFVGSVNNKQVYVLSGDNTARLRTVTPGNIFGESVEVISGLEEGERVIIAGQINLTDGAAVAIQED